LDRRCGAAGLRLQRAADHGSAKRRRHDAGFQAYATSEKANAGIVADEQKAMAAANAICATPPTDVAQAIVDVMAAYKAVVAATPAPS
jgi:hypothetical protein